jgi:hypothetical protein
VPIEDFFHEVAFNQMNAGRGQFVPLEPRWRRAWRLLTPALRRAIVLIVVLALGGTAYVCRRPILDFLRSHPAHGPGAADTLTFVTYRSAEHQRFERLAIACAREDDPRACMDALQHLATLTDAKTVATALQKTEVRALRVNQFFNQFALEIEKRERNSAAPPPAAPSPVTPSFARPNP